MRRTSAFELQVQLQKKNFCFLYHNACDQEKDLCISIRNVIEFFVMDEYRQILQNVERDAPVVFELRTHFTEVLNNYRTNSFVREVCQKICDTAYASNLVWENMFRIMKHSEYNRGECKKLINKAFPPYKEYEFKPRKRRKLQNEGEYLDFATVHGEVKKHLEEDSIEFLRISSPFQKEKETLLAKLDEMEKEVELMQKKMVSRGFCDENYWKIYLYRDPSINPLSELKEEYDNLVAKLKN